VRFTLRSPMRRLHKTSFLGWQSLLLKKSIQLPYGQSQLSRNRTERKFSPLIASTQLADGLIILKIPGACFSPYFPYTVPQGMSDRIVV
jgi:hypothetical protein